MRAAGHEWPVGLHHREDEGRTDTEQQHTVHRLQCAHQPPVVVPTADNWRDPEQREFYLSGLRLAMGETE